MADISFACSSGRDLTGCNIATRLELVQALRLPTTPTERKIELAMSFIDSVKSLEEDGAGDVGSALTETDAAWIKLPQVISFLSEWVQSALIRSSKPGVSSHPEEKCGVPAHLDSRYWSILKFCLLSGYLHRITGISPSLMRPLTSCISLSLSENLKVELIEVVSVLFTEYSRPLRSNLDSWVSLTSGALNLLRPDGKNISARDSAVVALVSGIVEGFSRTVASHPNPSKIFQSIVARLLEPLLEVIGDSISNGDQSLSKLISAAEDIIENGLFHSSHVRGYFEVCMNLKKKVDTNANGSKNSEGWQRSYHRTFFQKLDELRKSGNLVVLIGLGRTFKIYAKRWKAQRVALSEDVYGVRGQGKPELLDSIPGDKAERNGEVKLSDKSGADIEEEKDGESAAPHPKRHANETDALFTVFGELLGPLILELSILVGSEVDKLELTEEHVLTVSLLMRGVNELLAAAKESRAYKTLEDTLTLTYFNFLQEILNLIIKVGTKAFDAWSNGDAVTPVLKKKKRSSETESRANRTNETEIFREVVFALQHLLELEYRVFEEQLSSIWMFVFKMVAPAKEVKETTLKALDFCTGLVNMYSELRQVDIPIFHLTDTLTALQNFPQHEVLSIPVENIICSKTFLVTLGSVIHKLPEGQVANLLKGLRVAVTNSLNSFDSQQTTSLWRIKNFSGSAKGLLEVYTCILENANVTSSNSVLAGGAVRELLMKVLVPPMTDLVDVCAQSGIDSVGKDSSTQEHCVSSKTLFLLSMYVSSRVLHRQCLLLMPPKAARKARMSTLDVEINFLVADEAEVISYSKASEFLLSLQRESLKMSKFLMKLLQSSVIGDGLHLPTMIYIINTIAIQSLVDLDRRIWALKFLIGKAESKKYMKVLRSLEKEGTKLVSIVLQDLDAIKNEDTSLTIVKWNRVLTSLDFNMIHVARWRLICDTVDVWSTFANEEQLKNFVMALLHIGKARVLDDAKNLHNPEEGDGSVSFEESREEDLEDITDDLLKNLGFYELEGIRKVFATAFLQELKKILLSSFKEGCPIFNIIDDCIEGAAPPSAAESDAIFVEKVKLKTKSLAKLSTLKKLALNKEHQKAFRDCSRLLHVLASLPCGYLPSADNAGCAYTICQLEMVLVNFLLGDKEAVKHLKRSHVEAEPKHCPSDNVRLIWVDSLIACRRALHFLANSSASLEPSVISSDFTRTLFGSSTSTQCVTLLPEIVAMRTLETPMGMDDKNPQGPPSVPFKRNASSVFYSLLNETCAVIEASIANICCAEAKVLVSPNASLHVPTPAELKSRKRKSKKLRAVSALGTVLVAEAMSVENFLKTEQSSKWYGSISTVAAISSTLWSMTMALERVDKECRTSTSTSLVWRTELPEAWFFVVKELEPILVRILLQVLFPMGTSDLGFFTKTGVKASEVNDNVEQDLIGEDKFDEDDLRDIQEEESLNVTSSDEESDDDDTEAQGVPEVDGHDTEAMSEDLSFQALKTSVMEESSLSQFAFLHSALEGSTREKTEFIGELYMAVAAIVKLRSLFYSPFSFTSVSPELTDFVSFKEQSPHSLDTLLLAAYRLLLGSVQLIQTQKLAHPGWLVGVINYLGSVGAYLPCMKPFISPVDFVKLVNLHVELTGALVVLKENSATSTVKNLKDTMLERIEPSDWDLDDHDVGGLEARRSKRLERVDQIDDLLFSIRRSFESLLKYAPRQHMVLALQSVEKAVAGVWGGSDPGLGFDISEVRGCHVGPVAAAGVDCLGLALQAVSGKMRLHLLASHCPAFYGGLLNLISHCQGPSIFLERQLISVSRTRRLSVVDAAPVVLRSLEILTSLAARPVIFPMKVCFVAMALQCPAVLFRSFYDCGNPKALLQDLKATMREPFSQGFSEMSIRLYVACCKLLCALLRHRIRECGHSMALLGESCRILLQCLSAPSGREEADSSTAGGPAQCGSWLSRVYQEMESHKETMGKYCAHILADYLNVISGYNHGGSGLRREVDTALRPGAFALLDACSGNDLQQLHAALGEGARRGALMTLRHDYELHYKYTGKV